MKRPLFYFLLLLFLIGVSSCQSEHHPADYVNPFIGTGGHGHTFPGASLPFGMVQLSPDTRLEGWDGCSGYHYSDSIIYGFSHTHLSGTGIADYCDVLLMPTSGRYYLKNGYKSGVHRGYASRFRKKTEKASPGYYAVKLQDYNIGVELTASQRAGFQKYVFPADKKAFVTLDLTHRDKVLASQFRQINAYEVEGFRRSQSWAQDQSVYFYMKFNRPIKKVYLSLNDTLLDHQTEVNGKNIKVAFGFGKLKDDRVLLVKTGISAVSTQGARDNLNKEIPDWDFKAIREKAHETWNHALNKIQVKGDKVNKTIFYTALYHTMLAPNLYMDVDGKYRGTDQKIHQAEGFTNYTVFSLWDTFRATHPLYTLIEQKRDADFIKTFIHQYENGGQLPVWELAGNYTGCMIGYHAIPVIVDAYMKGIRNFDSGKAFEAMKHSAMENRLGLESYKKEGYISAEKEPESVSKTLEYAYDDWCIAQMASALGHPKQATYFRRRAQSYKNLFDPQTGFMRPKRYGLWKFPFDPTEVDFNYTEANAWQYTFFVPQDVSGLMQLMGGKTRFANKLDQLFGTSSKLNGRTQPDITGLIGQYAHGNEPSHHIAYLYDYAGQPWKTQARVRQILTEMYADKPDGLAGNEDCGQMSAWYVLSSMGFYSVTPGSEVYAIGTPVFKEVKMHLENGRSFVIKAKNLSPENKYIQSAALNGVPYDKAFITHKAMMMGGEMVFVMGDKPNKQWASQPGESPVSAINQNLILPVPYTQVKKRVFTGTVPVELFDVDSLAEIYYTDKKSLPESRWTLYTRPIRVARNVQLYYYAKKDTLKSHVSSMNLVKFPRGRSIRLYTRPNAQYTAGSDSALIDGLYGGNDFRSGGWQGYQGVNLNAVIDLGKITSVSYVSAHFLQDINSWIFMPKAVRYSVSVDGKHFRPLGKVMNSVPENQWGSILKSFTLKTKPVRARYVKVIGQSIVDCPSWHKGAGSQAFIFTDEITVK